MKIVAFRDRNPKLIILFIIISVLIIAKFGPYVYAMLIAIYIIIYYIKLVWSVYFHPKNPYNMFPRLMKGCFSLENGLWLDPELKSEFEALTKFAKAKGLKVTLYSEQLDAFGMMINNNPPDSDAHKNAKMAMERMDALQKFNNLKLLPPVPESSPNKIDCNQESEDANCINKTAVAVNVVHPPKPVPPIKKYFAALTYYASKCKSSYVSRDPELRVRVKQFNNNNPDKSIEVVMFPLFKTACDYINMFRIIVIEKHKEAKRLRDIKIGDTKKGMQDTAQALKDLFKKK